MTWYLSVALLAAIGYALLLRNNVKTLNKLLTEKEQQLIATKMILSDYKAKLKQAEANLGSFFAGLKDKKQVDTSKEGKELVKETNDLLTQPRLFDLDDDDDDNRFILSDN